MSTPLALHPLDDALRAAIRAGTVGDALGAAVAEGWEVFPGSATAACDARWGTRLFVARGPEGRALVGLGGFKGPPTDGEVELGYAIAPAWRGKGRATEAAAALLAEAFADPSVSAVVAHTLAAPGPSVTVLERLGFARVAEVLDPEAGALWRFRRDRHLADGFVGTWSFDPARAEYEGGPPPREGTYALAPIAGGVAFDIDWTDAEGNARHVQFQARFGEHDGLTMTRVDARTLDTTALAGPITHARRVLSDDGAEMIVDQSGTRADGSTFTNRSVYVRVAWAPRRGAVVAG